MYKLKITAVVALATFGAASQAVTLNLWLEPSTQIATVGQTVNIDVYANSAGASPLTLSDAYLAITWDSSVLTNSTPTVITEPAPWSTSYWAPGVNINADLQDGNAMRELLGEFPPTQPVAPVGVMRDAVNRIKVTTFSFTVNSLTSGTSVRLVDFEDDGLTAFFKGDFQIGTWANNFESGTYSEAMISTVPEPATLAVLGFGALVALRRKKVTK